MLLAQNSKENLQNVIGSRSTIRRDREKLRNQICEEIQKTVSNPTSLTVHLDSKNFKSLNSDAKVNRVVVVVSTSIQEGYHILAAPASLSGKGCHEADVVWETLNNYDLLNKIQAMCFDTTGGEYETRKWRLYIIGEENWKTCDLSSLQAPCFENHLELLF